MGHAWRWGVKGWGGEEGGGGTREREAVNASARPASADRNTSAKSATDSVTCARGGNGGGPIPTPTAPDCNPTPALSPQSLPWLPTFNGDASGGATGWSGTP